MRASGATKPNGPARRTCCVTSSKRSRGQRSREPTEDERLQAEEARLSDAAALREAAAAAVGELDSERSGVLDVLGRAVAHLEAREPFAELAGQGKTVFRPKLRISRPELRKVIETWEDDPRTTRCGVTTTAVQLADLRRKYGSGPGRGDPSTPNKSRVAWLISSHGGEAREVRWRTRSRSGRGPREGRGPDPETKAQGSATTGISGRREPEEHLRCRRPDRGRGRGRAGRRRGAVPARSEPGRAGTAAVARWHRAGSLRRAMLALRLVVAGGRPTLVFDEVDAGIGGAAAEAVGTGPRRTLAEEAPGPRRHPSSPGGRVRGAPVRRREIGHVGRTRAVVTGSTAEGRVEELARMLSGRPRRSRRGGTRRNLLEEAEQTRAQFRTTPGGMD